MAKTYYLRLVFPVVLVAPLHRPYHELKPTAHTHLPVKRRQLVFDSLVADAELQSDLLVRAPGDERINNLFLTRGQPLFHRGASCYGIYLFHVHGQEVLIAPVPLVTPR